MRLIFFLAGSGKPREVQVSLLHNPSHLEAVNPVSLGKTKAKQDDLGSQEKVLNVQLHGDAAHAGQGIIYESLAIGKMPKYSVGGSIHVIVNNQIGKINKTVFIFEDGLSNRTFRIYMERSIVNGIFKFNIRSVQLWNIP